MRITRVFLDTDMRMSFEGLRKIAQEAKTKLGEDSMILFLNHAATKFKVLTANKYVVYYSNGHRRIPLDALKHLPSTFGGTELAAIKKSLEGKVKV
jgi:hypothetical protein